jgi:hypothetical protein
MAAAAVAAGIGDVRQRQEETADDCQGEGPTNDHFEDATHD